MHIKLQQARNIQTIVSSMCVKVGLPVLVLRSRGPEKKMEVDLKFFKSLLGSQYQSDGLLSPLLYTQEAIDLLRKWYDRVPQPFRETHLLSFLRRCTNLSDAEILNIFDILDWDQSGKQFFILKLAQPVEPSDRAAQVFGILLSSFAACCSARSTDEAVFISKRERCCSLTPCRATTKGRKGWCLGPGSQSSKSSAHSLSHSFQPSRNAFVPALRPQSQIKTRAVGAGREHPPLPHLQAVRSCKLLPARGSRGLSRHHAGRSGRIFAAWHRGAQRAAYKSLHCSMTPARRIAHATAMPAANQPGRAAATLRWRSILALRRATSFSLSSCGSLRAAAAAA